MVRDMLLKVLGVGEYQLTVIQVVISLAVLTGIWMILRSWFGMAWSAGSTMATTIGKAINLPRLAIQAGYMGNGSALVASLFLIGLAHFDKQPTFDARGFDSVATAQVNYDAAVKAYESSAHVLPGNVAPGVEIAAFGLMLLAAAGLGRNVIKDRKIG